jgi:hypothetical protein
MPTEQTDVASADDDQRLTLPQLCRRQVEALARQLRLHGDGAPLPAIGQEEYQHG